METVTLSSEERARMNIQAAKGLRNILVAQLILLMIITCLAGLFGGWMSMLSAFAGGMAYVLPSTFVIVRMLIRLFANTNASAGALFIAEAIKIAGTIVLLLLFVKLAGSLIVWPALLLGLISVMKGYVLLLIFNKL
ncbi:hypothetical protein F9B74_06790 [Pelistega sp. NLN82]|uniref:ATP synthase protein I n=1 Tax=Pelistega ratti TaxID=2652177 RepID=A0A6L9Y6E4_9BURK|nr:ATP synthase subunit I [Pelistega ratti]NEN76030.1 hypothetical protein [Pelistega ratti]